MLIKAYIKIRKMVFPLRRKGTVTSVREDCKYGCIDCDIFVRHTEFHNGKQQLVLHGKVEYETYYYWKKNMLNARTVIFREETEQGEAAQESHNHGGIITEVINHGACGFITPIDMDKRVFVHNTHIVKYTSIPFTVGMRVIYI